MLNCKLSIVQFFTAGTNKESWPRGPSFGLPLPQIPVVHGERAAFLQIGQV